jgi:hypothetical protein
VLGRKTFDLIRKDNRIPSTATALRHAQTKNTKARRKGIAERRIKRHKGLFWPSLALAAQLSNELTVAIVEMSRASPDSATE